MTRKHDDDESHDVESHAKAPAKSAPSPEEIDRAVENMSRLFAGAVPEQALAEGSFDVPEDDGLRRIKTDVPDGRYRVTGHEWILEFAGGRLVRVEHATPDADDDYTSVPQPRS